MALSIRTQRRLYSASALVLSAAVVYVWVFNSPGGLQQNDVATKTTITPTGATDINLETTPGVPPLTAFRELRWDRTLRAPLYDPPPPPPPEVKPPPPLNLKLLGTVIEPNGRSQAMLTASSGQVQMHRVGDVIENATLLNIEPNAVTVTYYDQTLTLTPPPGN